MIISKTNNNSNNNNKQQNYGIKYINPYTIAEQTSDLCI